MFMSFYLESCVRPDAVSWWVQHRNRKYASNIVQISEKCVAETPAMIVHTLREESMNHTWLFEWHPWFRTGWTSIEDDQHVDRLSHTYFFTTEFWPKTTWLSRMVSSGMLRHVALVRTDVLEELSASCRLLVTASTVPSSPILVTLMKESLSSSETSVLTRATWHNITEDTILHSHRCENPTCLVWPPVAFISFPDLK
jgi:hypothetical protein